MLEDFSSKALEVNLERTRDKVIDIPEEQQRFLEFSKSKWGINKRTQEFIVELNHKYVNYQYVIEAIHTISLTDLWFYNSIPESEDALTTLVNIFKSLIDSDLDEKNREQLIKTLIKFIDRLASLEGFPKNIVWKCLDIITEDIEIHEDLYIKNLSYFKTYLDKISQYDEYKDKLLDLTCKLLLKSIDYWESTSEIEEWLKDKNPLFQPSNQEKFREIGKPFFKRLRKDLDLAKDWDQVYDLMFFNDIANYFRSFTEKFDTSLEKIYYLYYLLHLPGMAHLKDHLLYDINRNLRNVLKELDENDVTKFLDTIIILFDELKVEHGGTVLDCILTLGKEVINSKNQSAISYFVQSILKLGFNYPGKLTVNSDWQIQINNNHVKNIRVWLELIGYSPYDMRGLLEALIVNLKLGGIFISDKDLFQRDVTKLLNSNVEPVYREIKQLARIFPIYFREIGAEGKLREITTTVDELSWRKDRLIHFLRKQVHTESNNTHIELTKRIILYWYYGEKEILKEIIPKDVYEWLDTKSYWFIYVNKVLIELCEKIDIKPEQLFLLDIKELNSSLIDISTEKDSSKKRLVYLFQIYSLLLEKYSLESEDILVTLKKYGLETDVNLEDLQEDIDKNRYESSLIQIYKLMNQLKKIILNSKESVAQEEIYYKRHIAVGIPSMYGQYIEPKFEALGLMFRLERIASKLMVELLQKINLEYITAKTFRRIYGVLELFREGLELDGIYNVGFNSNLDMFKYSLSSPSFSLDQYINIFQFMAQDIKQIINEYFIDLYERPLKVIIPQVHDDDGKLSEADSKKRHYTESEKFLRENLSYAFLVQDLDNFITNIISTLSGMIDNYSDGFNENIMTYDPDLTLSPLNRPTVEMDNPVFLGAKAFFLKKLIAYGFPVPPGFVLTTEVFRHKETVTAHPQMRHELNKYIKKYISEIEGITSQKFGDPNNPLLFSVRSGSAFSLPGAMKTFLNVGMNDEITEKFSKKEGYEWTAWDCYRRFLQSWGMAYGIDRDVFDEVINEHKRNAGIELKIEFSPEQMKGICKSYKKVLLENEIKIEEDPFLQLRQAIHNVIDSWFTESAISYRTHSQIADEWGTAVIVQRMVLGNLSLRSGTGVVFTNNPFSGRSGINFYGDFALCSQGEDVVSGLVNTLPITEKQRKEYFGESDISLELAFPNIYQELLNIAGRLIEHHGFVHQEIEFTFESDDPESLYILQIRNLNLKTKKNTCKFIDSPKEMKLIGRGMGIGGGALSGILAFDMDNLNDIKETSPDEKTILVRPDTVPDDIPMIFNCDGLITGKGGATSHAAVTASSLGKVCIVNCKDLRVDEINRTCNISGKEYKVGDKISIDGNLGNIYEGSHEVKIE